MRENEHTGLLTLLGAAAARIAWGDWSRREQARSNPPMVDPRQQPGNPQR
jgi:hypothetical protein